MFYGWTYALSLFSQSLSFRDSSVFIVMKIILEQSQSYWKFGENDQLLIIRPWVRFIIPNILWKLKNTLQTEREIKETIPFTIATKRIEYLGVYLPKETKDLYIENYNTDERNQRGHKQMEKYTVFMDWKNQYCQNGYTTQSNL